MQRRDVSYLRISQDRDGDDLAIGRQRADIEARAASRNEPVAEEYLDRVSAAGRKRRPDFERLLADIERGGIRSVYAWAFDRLTRHARDTVRLLDACRVHKVTLRLVSGDDIDVTTPAGELAASVMASVARHEIAQKGLRQTRQRRQEAEEGRTPPARRAFGYTDRQPVAGEKYPVAHLHPLEAPLMGEAYRQVLAGRSMGSVARWLNEQDAPTPRGRPWTSRNLQVAMVNPRYKGVRGVRMLKPGREGEDGKRDQFHTEIAAGNWPAIVDADTWAAVQAILRDPARAVGHPHGEHGARYLLPFLARCATCGSHLITGMRKTVSRVDGSATHDRLLRCSTLRHVSRKAAPIEAFVVEYLLAALGEPEARAVLRRRLTPGHLDLEQLRNRISELRARKDAASAEWADGHIDTASLRLVHQRIETQLSDLDGELAAALGTSPMLELANAEQPRDVWERWPIEVRRTIVGTYLDVVVDAGSSGRPGGRRFDPSSVHVQWKTL